MARIKLVSDPANPGRMKEVSLSADEETKRDAEEAADAAKPAVKPPATLADIWAVVKSKTGATDADLPAEVEPPKARGA